jgi:hypothetical protein
MNRQEQVNYLTYDQAEDLVDRIADRASNFGHNMTTSEKEAMSELLSDIGVNTSDLIDVANLADNYAINAEFITPDDYDNYSNVDFRDSLFQWEESDGTHYCYQW